MAIQDWLKPGQNVCRTCHGDGEIGIHSEEGSETCSDCFGTGIDGQVKCPDCNGLGEFPKGTFPNVCLACNGTGNVSGFTDQT